jgi:hypothetical protein
MLSLIRHLSWSSMTSLVLEHVVNVEVSPWDGCDGWSDHNWLLRYVGGCYWRNCRLNHHGILHNCGWCWDESSLINFRLSNWALVHHVSWLIRLHKHCAARLGLILSMNDLSWHSSWRRIVHILRHIRNPHGILHDGLLYWCLWCVLLWVLLCVLLRIGWDYLIIDDILLNWRLTCLRLYILLVCIRLLRWYILRLSNISIHLLLH